MYIYIYIRYRLHELLALNPRFGRKTLFFWNVYPISILPPENGITVYVRTRFRVGRSRTIGTEKDAGRVTVTLFRFFFFY